MNELQLVHFQITRSCNLRCWFCGQWGKQGFLRDDGGKALGKNLAINSSTRVVHTVGCALALFSRK